MDDASRPPAAGDGSANAAGGSSAALASSSKATIERDRRRKALKAANSNVWESGPTTVKGPFDSNIKKNTGFIKRVRQTLGQETKEQLIREVGTLNLDKYIEEVIQAIPEGLAKCVSSKDYAAAAESVSALFQRFGSSLFASPLSSLLASQLQMPNKATLQALPADQRERDETARVARQRVLLRACAELAIVDVLRSEKGKGRAVEDTNVHLNEEWLFSTLRELLATDKEHSNAAILIALLKGVGSTLVGAGKNNGSEEGGGQGSTEAPLIDLAAQSRFRKLAETYVATLARRMVREHEKLQDQDKRNHEAYIRSGQVFEDRQQNYEQMAKTFEKVQQWTHTLSELLDVKVPSLSTEAKAGSAVGIAINLDGATTGNDDNDAQYASGKSLWEDEDTRRFYEDVVDLADLVPPAILGYAKGQAVETDATEADATQRADVSPQLSPHGSRQTSPQLSPEPSPRLTSATDGSDAPDAKLNAGPAAQLNALLAKLPELSSAALIDSAAVDFAFIANKLARRKLIKLLIAVPRHRSDLIPYYARLVAALNKYMPDVGLGVIALLEDEFRYLQKKRIPELAETRAKNMRFIGELVKFRVAPLITTFHCFKVLLDDFHRTNVENIAILLETCGRFLLRSAATTERMQTVLELVRRKRAAANLDQNLVVMLDNAYYQVNPPEREAVQAKERSPLELYVRHLIYDELNRQTVDAVLQRVRKLPWDDKAVRETLQNAFIRPWRIKYSHLHLLAVLLNDLQTYHMDFVVFVIDTVCEQIRAGMESNVFRDNQRRVATIKYFGELYNYRLINTGLVFEVLWSLVTFGHPRGQPLPGQVSSIDSPDDYFRIRLVCTLLDACGQCFDRGSSRKRLDDFLLMLNMYILSKSQPLPMDADFMLSDTLELLRPKFSLKLDFDEAARAVDEMLAAQRARVAATIDSQRPNAQNGGTAHNDAKGDDTSDSESDGDSDAESADGPRAPRHASKDVAHGDSEASSSESGSEAGEAEDDVSTDDDDETMRRDGQSSFDQEAEDEFSRELAKMMAETNAAASTASASRSQRGLFDIGMPFIKKMQAQPSATGSTKTVAPALNAKNVSGGDDVAAPEQHMRFSLLSKRGNKQQTHDVHVPMDAALAVHSRANEQQQMAEREQLKKLVLGFETREQAQNDRDRNLFMTGGRRGQGRS